MPRTLRTPTAQRFLEAFEGRIYKPLAKDVGIARGHGWGGGNDGSIDHLSLRFELGRSKESVVADVSSNPHRGSISMILIHLLWELEQVAKPRFPLLIERGRQKIPIEGREHAFTTYTTGPVAVAVGTVDDLVVTMRCRKRRLPKLALGLIEASELREALRAP